MAANIKDYVNKTDEQLAAAHLDAIRRDDQMGMDAIEGEQKRRARVAKRTQLLAEDEARKEEAAAARQREQRRRAAVLAALDLVDEVVAASEAEVEAAESLAEHFGTRTEKMGELHRACEALGHTDFNFNGLTLSFEADLANRMTTKGVRHFRGQRHGSPPDAALNPDIIATIRRRLTRALER